MSVMISSDHTGVYTNEMTLGWGAYKVSGWGLSPERPRDKKGEFSALLSNLGGWRVNSTKTFKRDSELVNTQKCWGSREAPCPLPIPCLCISSIWLLLSCIFYNKCKESLFQSLVSHSGQLSNLRREFWEPPIFS